MLRDANNTSVRVSLRAHFYCHGELGNIKIYEQF